MKLNMYFALLALSGMSFQSCDNDNLDNSKVPEAVKQSFTNKYPSATRVEWETKGTYYEVEFVQNKLKTAAWFAQDGTWEMTETDIPYSALPVEVRTDFEKGIYAQWRKDDVDQLERKEQETIFILDVESSGREMDLYYSKAGILMKELPDADDSHTPF